MRIGCSTEYYKYRSCRLIGLSTSTMTSRFPTGLCGFASIPAPVPLRVRVHPLLSLISSSELLTTLNLPNTSAKRLPWGSAPHRDIREKSPLFGEFPYSPLFHPQCFSHSRRLTPLHTLRAYFIPQPRPGFTLQGFSPPPSRPASSATRPLMSISDLFLPPSCLNGARAGSLTFRGFIRVAIRSD
jgi:hypothetical protein